jgi:hypothetical protein
MGGHTTVVDLGHNMQQMVYQVPNIDMNATWTQQTRTIPHTDWRRTTMQCPLSGPVFLCVAVTATIT